jgi:RNA polymerase sigma factor (sigma-70 family)
MEHIQDQSAAIQSASSKICDDGIAGSSPCSGPLQSSVAPLSRDSSPAVWEYWIRVAWRLARNRHWCSPDSADLAQNAILVLYLKASVESIQYPKAFLVSCMLRLELRRARASRVAARNAGEVELSAASPATPEESLCTREQEELLEMALSKLPQDEREFVRRRYYDELTDKEIAEATSKSIGTVKRQRSKTLEHLRRDKTLTPGR